MGMKGGETRQGSHLLVNLWVVLHGTAAQGIEPGVHTEIVVGHVSIVAHGGKFVHLWQYCLALAEKVCRQVLQCVTAPLVLRQRITNTSGGGKFEYEFSVICVVHNAFGYFYWLIL